MDSIKISQCQLQLLKTWSLRPYISMIVENVLNRVLLWGYIFNLRLSFYIFGINDKVLVWPNNFKN